MLVQVLALCKSLLQTVHWSLVVAWLAMQRFHYRCLLPVLLLQAHRTLDITSYNSSSFHVHLSRTTIALRCYTTVRLGGH